MQPIKVTPEVHEKAWGREIWYTNTPFYCGKTLEFYKGGKTSMHSHPKREHFLVVRGFFELSYIDTDKATRHSINLKEGDVFYIPPTMPHAIHALENDSAIIEFSTQHIEEEVLRFEKGDSQK